MRFHSRYRVTIAAVIGIAASSALAAGTAKPAPSQAAAPAEISAPATAGTSDAQLTVRPDSTSVHSAAAIPAKPAVTDTLPASVRKSGVAKPPAAELETDSTATATADTEDTRSALLARTYGIRDIRQMRLDAQRLRREAEKIRSISGRLDDEAEVLENRADNLMDKARENRKAAEEVAAMGADTGAPADSFAVRQKEFIERHKSMMAKMQESATELLRKSKEIALRVRELEEEADHRDELADSISQKAEDMDPTPFARRFPWSIGLSARVSSVGPYGNNNLHVLAMSGALASYTFNDMIGAGIQDIGFYSAQTIDGSRYAIAATPFVEVSRTFARRLQVGLDLGGEVQGRFGAGQPQKGAVAPFITLFDRNWVWKHFSLGPFFRFNWAAYGPQFTYSNRSGILPEGALWSDFGMNFCFSF